METKLCTKCKKVKPVSEFPVYNGKINSHCFQCKRDYNAKYRKTPAGIYQNIKSGSKFYGHICSITQDEFIDWYEAQEKKCSYCDLPENLLEPFLSQYTSRFMRFTVDCIVPSLGYAVGNITIACDKCNSTKNNLFTFEEMREIAQKYIKPKWMKLVEQP